MIINCHHYAWNRFINTETITPLAQSCLIKGIQINVSADIKLRPYDERRHYNLKHLSTPPVFLYILPLITAKWEVKWKVLCVLCAGWILGWGLSDIIDQTRVDDEFISYHHHAQHILPTTGMIIKLKICISWENHFSCDMLRISGN